MQAELDNNRVAANILNDMIAKGWATQDENGNIDIPTASKKKNRNVE